MTEELAGDLAQNASQFAVEVSSHSHLTYATLKQYNEVVFWERPNLPNVYPVDTDVFTVLQVQDRVDNMAFAAYQDPNLWWLLAVANDTPLPPLLMNPGFKFRMPSGKSVIALLRGGPNQA
jgi:hypothetical protein